MFPFNIYDFSTSFEVPPTSLDLFPPPPPTRVHLCNPFREKSSALFDRKQS